MQDLAQLLLVAGISDAAGVEEEIPAAKIDPEHVMVRLLRAANEQCLSPELWDRFVDRLEVPA